MILPPLLTFGCAEVVDLSIGLVEEDGNCVMYIKTKTRRMQPAPRKRMGRAIAIVKCIAIM